MNKMIYLDIKDIIQFPFTIATTEDLSFLLKLENECFEDYRRSNKDMIKRSIQSKSQWILIIYNEGQKCGSITFRKFKKTLRITSVAVLPKERDKGLGEKLLNKVIDLASYLDMKLISLEVDANNNNLIRWYEGFGFEQYKVLENYYYPKKHAIRMRMQLTEPKRYIVVTDFETDFFEDMENVKHIRSTEYIESELYQTAKDIRVFNFCANYKYQSVGYYVSLLALARNQVAYPSAGLIRDIDNQRVIKSIGEEVNDMIHASLDNTGLTEITINSYFGISDVPMM